MFFNIGNSCLYCLDNYNIINDYYQYIVELIKKFLINNKELEINIILCNENYLFNNNNKILRIGINYEHTLVKKGGRDSNNSPIGNVKDNDNNYYLVRIDRYNKLIDNDIIIDYSMPNIHNVVSSLLFNEFSKKHIYIASSIYDSYILKENRNITTLTTFINTNEQRRKKLLDKIQDEKIEHINVNNCFNKDDLCKLYKNTKIIINIHQTDHHHTFEELRVLPALQCGVIVICENSPLNNLIPYNDFIIWSNYDEILDKVKDVINNYEYYHNLIFNSSKKSLDELNNSNYNTINNAIKNNLYSIFK